MSNFRQRNPDFRLGIAEFSWILRWRVGGFALSGCHLFCQPILSGVCIHAAFGLVWQHHSYVLATVLQAVSAAADKYIGGVWHEENKQIYSPIPNGAPSYSYAASGREEKSSREMRACETLAVFTITRVLAGRPGFTQRSLVLRSPGLGSFWKRSVKQN